MAEAIGDGLSPLTEGNSLGRYPRSIVSHFERSLRWQQLPQFRRLSLRYPRPSVDFANSVSGEPIAIGELSKLYRSIDWPGCPNAPMTVADVKRLTGSLVDRGILLKESYSSVSSASHLQAAAVQSAIHEETFGLIRPKRAPVPARRFSE